MKTCTSVWFLIVLNRFTDTTLFLIILSFIHLFYLLFLNKIQTKSINLNQSYKDTRYDLNKLKIINNQYDIRIAKLISHHYHDCQNDSQVSMQNENLTSRFTYHWRSTT